MLETSTGSSRSIRRLLSPLFSNALGGPAVGLEAFATAFFSPRNRNR